MLPLARGCHSRPSSRRLCLIRPSCLSTTSAARQGPRQSPRQGLTPVRLWYSLSSPSVASSLSSSHARRHASQFTRPPPSTVSPTQSQSQPQSQIHPPQSPAPSPQSPSPSQPAEPVEWQAARPSTHPRGEYEEALRLLALIGGNFYLNGADLIQPVARPANSSSTADSTIGTTGTTGFTDTVADQETVTTSTFSPPAYPAHAPSVATMALWMARLGFDTPEDLARYFRFVHVTGTKGKGTTSCYIASILRQWHLARQTREANANRRQNGRNRPRERTKSATPDPSQTTAETTPKVGTFLSPHVLTVRDRIMIDGEPISEEKFGRYFLEVWNRLSEASVASGEFVAGAATGPWTKPPPLFRLMFLVALHVFRQEGVRDVVLEVGMGGEYDATNIIPAASVTTGVITELAIEHVKDLGETKDKIAWHKAGIMKPGMTVFTRRLVAADDLPAAYVMRSRARAKQATLVELTDEDFQPWKGFPSGLPSDGPFLERNRALAVRAALNHLGVPYPERGEQQLPAWVLDGLRETRVRGRLEKQWIQGALWCFDGAHTVESVDLATTWFAQQCQALEEGDDALRRRSTSDHRKRGRGRHASREEAVSSSAAAPPSTVDVYLVFNQPRRAIEPLLTRVLDTLRRELPSVTVKLAVFSDNEPEALPIPPKHAQEREGRQMQPPRRKMDAQFVGKALMRTLSPETLVHCTDNLRDAVKVLQQHTQKSLEEGRRPAVLITGSMHLVGNLLHFLEQNGP